MGFTRARCADGKQWKKNGNRRFLLERITTDPRRQTLQSRRVSGLCSRETLKADDPKWTESDEKHAWDVIAGFQRTTWRLSRVEIERLNRQQKRCQFKNRTIQMNNTRFPQWLHCGTFLQGCEHESNGRRICVRRAGWCGKTHTQDLDDS